MYQSLHASRAVAATLVVLSHLGGAIAAPRYFNEPWFGVPFAFGGAGVEYFFVLSGFIILTAHGRDIGQPGRFGNYLQKRILRIYPAYWIAFLGVLALGLLAPGLRGTFPSDPMVLLKALLLLPQDKAIVGGTGAPLIIVAWTLHYELLFYACFALLILNRWLGAAAALLWGIIYVVYWRDPAAAFPWSFLAQDYLLLFVLGVLCQKFSSSVAFQKLSGGGLFVTGLLLFLTVALDHVLRLQLLIDGRILLYGLGSGLMILGLLRLEDRGRVLGAQPLMQTLGDASYALYLIHFPLISLLCKVAVALQLRQLGVAGAFIAWFGILAACLWASVQFHRHIEKPAAALLKRGLDRMRASPAASAPTG